MTNRANRIFLITVVTIAILAVVLYLIVAVAAARVPSYALKGIVLDKTAADNWFEVRITEQTKGKTDLRGDRLIVRVLKTTSAYNKSNKAQSTKNWLSSVKNDDAISVLGEYKKADGTIWSDKIVNRSR